jgi:hypothetical protein
LASSACGSCLFNRSCGDCHCLISAGSRAGSSRPARPGLLRFHGWFGVALLSWSSRTLIWTLSGAVSNILQAGAVAIIIPRSRNAFAYRHHSRWAVVLRRRDPSAGRNGRQDRYRATILCPVRRGEFLFAVGKQSFNQQTSRWKQKIWLLQQGAGRQHGRSPSTWICMICGGILSLTVVSTPGADGSQPTITFNAPPGTYRYYCVPVMNPWYAGYAHRYSLGKTNSRKRQMSRVAARLAWSVWGPPLFSLP